MTNEPDNQTMETSFNEWEEEITFWIEGVLTPIVSAAGIIGKVCFKYKNMSLYTIYNPRYQGHRLRITILS